MRCGSRSLLTRPGESMKTEIVNTGCVRQRIVGGVVPSLIAAAILFVAPMAQSQECTDCHETEIVAHLAHAEVQCAACHVGNVEFPHPEDASPAPCGDCHGDREDQLALGVHGQQFAAGNEMAPDCLMCHGEAHEVERPGTTPFRRATAETCGICHAEEYEDFTTSVHGKALGRGDREAPNCVTCHGEHQNQVPSETVHVGMIRETCAGCHADLELTTRFGIPDKRVVSFDQSYHGLAAATGSQTVANCASCHGVHHILPSSDPDSSIHPAHLPDTCGKCHPGAGSRFVLGPIHVLEGQGQAPIADLIRLVYLFMIPIVIGLMVVHNAGDWIRKLIRRRNRSWVRPPMILETRMLPVERVQHALLVVSFAILTWTGFALKFPDGFWAWPLVAPGPEFRGDIHRASAIVFLATSLFHIVTLIVSRPLRKHWLELMPAVQDIPEAMSNFIHNIGLRRDRPPISTHSYVEKAEYWAVVWGSVIMSATGIILWANDFFLSRFPKALMDISTTIHYYEAILAALAIVVWHFYSVIFDPDVYPMSLAWLTGLGPKRTNDQDEDKIVARSEGFDPGDEEETNGGRETE